MSKTYVQLLTHNNKDISKFNVYYCEGHLYRMDATNTPKVLKPGTDGSYYIGYRAPQKNRQCIKLNLNTIVKNYNTYISPLGAEKESKEAMRHILTTNGEPPIPILDSSSSDEEESTEHESTETESDHPKQKLDVSVANSGDYIDENLYRRLHIRMLWEIKEAIKGLGMKPDTTPPQ
jgi:hypothetical protein